MLLTATVHAGGSVFKCYFVKPLLYPPLVKTFQLFLKVVYLAGYGGQALTPQTVLTSPSSIAPIAHWSWRAAALCPVTASV